MVNVRIATIRVGFTWRVLQFVCVRLLQPWYASGHVAITLYFNVFVPPPIYAVYLFFEHR